MCTLREGSNYSTTPWFFQKLCCTFSVLVSHIWEIKMNILQKLFQGKCIPVSEHGGNSSCEYEVAVEKLCKIAENLRQYGACRKSLFLRLIKRRTRSLHWKRSGCSVLRFDIEQNYSESLCERDRPLRPAPFAIMRFSSSVPAPVQPVHRSRCTQVCIPEEACGRSYSCSQALRLRQ